MGEKRISYREKIIRYEIKSPGNTKLKKFGVVFFRNHSNIVGFQEPLFMTYPIQINLLNDYCCSKNRS